MDSSFRVPIAMSSDLDPSILEVCMDRHMMRLPLILRQVVHEVLRTMNAVHVNRILSLRDEEAQTTLDYMQKASSFRRNAIKCD